MDNRVTDLEGVEVSLPSILVDTFSALAIVPGLWSMATECAIMNHES